MLSYTPQIPKYIQFITALSVGGLVGVHADLKSNLQQSIEDTAPNVQSNRNIDEAEIFAGVQDIIFQVVGIITIVMILYVAYRLIIVKGNVDEFKKESKALIFIIVGLAIIPLSYFIIQYLTNLNL